MSSIGSTVSALFASQLRVSNAANNIANATSKNFTPQDVVQTNDAGSVHAELVDRTPSTYKTLNASGEQEDTPNVDTTLEVIQAQIGTYDFKANATVLKTQQQLQKKLLDILA